MPKWDKSWKAMGLLHDKLYHPLDSMDAQEAFVVGCLQELAEMGVYEPRRCFEGSVRVDDVFNELVYDPVVTGIFVEK